MWKKKKKKKKKNKKNFILKKKKKKKKKKISKTNKIKYLYSHIIISSICKLLFYNFFIIHKRNK